MSKEAMRAEPTRWHELKTDPDVFDAVADGRKTFEIRYNDRDYQPGDGLLLRRTRDTGWAMKNTGAPLEYTGEELRVRVAYVLRGPVYGLADGWAIMSIAALSLLRAELEAGGEAEPVAWRYRYRARDDYPAGPWYLSDRELEMTPGQEIEPLYASPVAADTQGDAKGVPDMALELLVAAGHITQAKADEALTLARSILGEPAVTQQEGTGE